MTVDKKYLAFNHFEPEMVLKLKNIPDEDMEGDWITLDVTGKTGKHIVINDDESIYTIELNKSVEEMDEEIYNEIVNFFKDNPDDLYEDIEWGIYIKRTDDPSDYAHILSDKIRDSYVDCDSSAQWQVMDLSDSEFDEYSDMFDDESDYDSDFFEGEYL